ncbi:MAG: hypothetical protein E7510_06730 [Ruminococcus sp.]|nr:hypothetical protein [Ruminococcus sp.]
MVDGKYMIDVELTGGSGKATVKSPAELIVDNGDMQAKIEWNSPNYDYMKIGDEEYYPEPDNENSVFIINVSELDKDIEITAQTVAMSKPRMIDYTLHFDSSTMENADKSFVPFIVAGGILAVMIISAVVLIKNRKKKNNESKI